MVKRKDLRAEHREVDDLEKKPNKQRAGGCQGSGCVWWGGVSPLLCSTALNPLLSYRLDFLFSFFFSFFFFFQADEPSSHTMESLISEPSLTRGRGLVGEYSTWLSLALSGRRSDASEKLLLLSGDDSWVGVLQM